MSGRPDRAAKDDSYPVLLHLNGLGPRMHKIQQGLARIVIGQGRAVEHTLRLAGIQEARIQDPNRPAGVMIFAGPPGCGKTLLAKSIGKVVLGLEDCPVDVVTYIQCGNYKEEHTLSTLLGSPPGYVGSQKRGSFSGRPLLHQLELDKYHFFIRARRELALLLPELGYSFESESFDVAKVPDAFWEQPAVQTLWGYYRADGYKSVVVFDEIENAHPVVHDFLLGVFEDGHTTLRNGDPVDFRRSLIILTTNVGNVELQQHIAGGMGLLAHGRASQSHEELEKRIWRSARNALRRFFKPQFVSRLGDEIVVFRPLDEEDFRKILGVQLAEVQTLLNRRCAFVQAPPVHIFYEESVIEFLLREGMDKQLGARILRDKVRHYVKDLIARGIERDEIRGGDHLCFKMSPEGRPMISRARRRTGEPSKSLLVEEDEKEPKDLTLRWGTRVKRLRVRPNNQGEPLPPGEPPSDQDDSET